MDNVKKSTEILLESLKRNGISRRQIEKEFDLSENYISQAQSRGGSEKLYKRLKRFADELLQKSIPGSEIQEPEQSFIEKRRSKKNHETQPGVPVYGGFTTLGNITVYDDENNRNQVIGTLPPNIFPNCDYAEKAKGDSMYPLIMNQALLVGKQCPVDGISYGEKYIIKTKQGLDTTKFVHPVLDDNKKRIEGKILLVAHNKSVPAQEVNVKDVIFSCRVHWIVNPT